MDFHSLEKTIQQFVQNEIAEGVNLDIKTDSLSVKHQSSKGSTRLAVLWANLLQNKHNFPKKTFPYKQQKDNGTEKLILHAEDMTMTIYMKKGTLFIQGRYALDWSKKRLIQLIQNYNLPDGVNPGESDQGIKYPQEDFPPDRYHHYSRFATEKISPWSGTSLSGAENTARIPGTDLCWREPRIDASGDNHADLSLLDTNDPSETEQNNAEGLEEENQNEEGEIAATQEFSDKTDVVDSLISGLTDVDIGVLTGGDLEEQVDLVKLGGFFDGPTFIYTLWKGLLHKWFRQGAEVYIVTPFLDAKHLKDIVESFLRNKNTSNLGAFYVRKKCDNETSITAVKEEVLNKYSPQEQLSVQYQIFSKIIYPIKRFHGKLIAGVKDGKVDVLLTSANFHSNHFVADNLETVSIISMTKTDFRRRYLNKLLGD